MSKAQRFQDVALAYTDAGAQVLMNVHARNDLHSTMLWVLDEVKNIHKALGQPDMKEVLAMVKTMQRIRQRTEERDEIRPEVEDKAVFTVAHVSANLLQDIVDTGCKNAHLFEPLLDAMNNVVMQLKAEEDEWFDDPEEWVRIIREEVWR